MSEKREWKRGVVEVIEVDEASAGTLSGRGGSGGRGHVVLTTPSAGLPPVGRCWRAADGTVLIAVPVADLALMLFADGLERTAATGRVAMWVNKAEMPPETIEGDPDA